MGVVSGGANCIEVQFIFDALLENVAGPAVGYSVYNPGVMNAIRSSLNAAGVSSVDTQRLQVLPDDQGNQKCKYQVWYKTPNCRRATECTGEESLCPTETSIDRDRKCAYPDMGPCLKDGFKQTLPDYRCMVEGETAHFVDNLRRVYEGFKLAINERWREQLISILGNYLTLDGSGNVVDSASNPRTVYYPNKITADTAWFGFAPIKNEYARARMMLSPTIVGGSSVINYGIFQDQTGRSGTQGAPYNVFYDPEIDLDLGSDRLISFIPGSVTPLFWTDAKPGQAPLWNTSTKVRDAFNIGAAFGDEDLWVERIIQKDDCEEAISYSFKLWTDLFWVPADAYNLDCQQRSNLILQWQASCAEYDCSNIIAPGGVIAAETT